MIFGSASELGKKSARFQRAAAVATSNVTELTNVLKELKSKGLQVTIAHCEILWAGLRVCSQRHRNEVGSG